MNKIWQFLQSIGRTGVAVLFFIILMLMGFCHEAKAEVTAEVGAGFLRGQYTHGNALYVHEKFEKYSIGMGYIHRQYVHDRSGNRYEVRENLFLTGQRHVCFYKCRVDLGLGVGYWNGTNLALGSHFTAALSITLRPGKHLSLNIRHWSNAGSVTPNLGQDMLTIGWTF